MSYPLQQLRDIHLGAPPAEGWLSGHGSLLLSATVPPAQLVLREDLRTRMGLCAVYQIQPLSDEEKAALETKRFFHCHAIARTSN